ncbi:MAG: methyltransferase domain-containing protein, partial [Candidatus Eremiobacteraeota bacterium]|nr:methyltransferase domain-containing protein [Candidatus Eremiobacteraeota bacterium]
MSEAFWRRQQLAARLARDGVLRDERVGAAIEDVPRHVFAPDASIERAYEDRVLRVKEHEGVVLSTLSQPAMIVEMLEQLDVQPADRVLEIGTGSGYTSALLAHLTGKDGSVVTIDLESDLAEAASLRFQQLGITNVESFSGDGAFGAPERGPFDRILLTAATSDIELAWWNQLGAAGRIVLPLSLTCMQKSIAFDRSGATLQSVSAVDCAFIMARGAAKGECFISIAGDPTIRIVSDHELNVDVPMIAHRVRREEPAHRAIEMH